MGSTAACWIALAVCLPIAGQEEPPATFGTTTVLPAGLRGNIYYLHHNAKKLPDFEKMKRKGVIYTASLNVPPQKFQAGFPGVSKRFEWFAIDYAGRFWIDKPGLYQFDLLSDDGSRLYIDDRLIIDNDGQHPPETRSGSVNLTGGIHNVRVSYFQGPRFEVALVLRVAHDGEPPRVFSTDEFKPPLHPEHWP